MQSGSEMATPLMKVLSDVVFESAVVYLDNILLIGRNFPDHLKYLEKLF